MCPPARGWAHRTAKARGPKDAQEGTNKRGPGTIRAVPIIPEGGGKWRKVGDGDSGCKPARLDRIYGLSTRRPRHLPGADLSRQHKRKAGRGRGVFAISLACHRRRRIADSRWTPPQPKARWNGQARTKYIASRFEEGASSIRKNSKSGGRQPSKSSLTKVQSFHSFGAGYGVPKGAFSWRRI